MKGIPEPYDKRTVEGDLGVRYNAATILETVGAKPFADAIGLSEQAVAEWVAHISANTDALPQNDAERTIDIHLAYEACRIAVYRHAGYNETYYSPLGATWAQYGKDLTQFKTVIGTGGPLVHQARPELVLQASLFNKCEPERLRPKQPQFYVDSRYILYAVGLLGERYPGLALRLAKKYLTKL